MFVSKTNLEEKPKKSDCLVQNMLLYLYLVVKHSTNSSKLYGFHRYQWGWGGGTSRVSFHRLHHFPHPQPLKKLHNTRRFFRNHQNNYHSFKPLTLMQTFVNIIDVKTEITKTSFEVEVGEMVC